LARDRLLRGPLQPTLILKKWFCRTGIRRDGTAVYLAEPTTLGKLFQVTSDRHIRNFERANQVTDAHGPIASQESKDLFTALTSEHGDTNRAGEGPYL